MPRSDWEANPVDKLFSAFWPPDVHSVLDVGCGLSLKSQYVDVRFRVGVDIYRPFLEAIDANVPYALVQADVRDIGKLFIPKSFDVVLALDVLEHLEKPEALRVLDACERLARKAVCVEVPLGYIPQNIDIWGLGGDHWQTHRSAWRREEFWNRGYVVKTRPYRMSAVKRHTELDVDLDITMLDAIKVLKRI